MPKAGERKAGVRRGDDRGGRRSTRCAPAPESARIRALDRGVPGFRVARAPARVRRSKDNVGSTLSAGGRARQRHHGKTTELRNISPGETTVHGAPNNCCRSPDGAEQEPELTQNPGWNLMRPPARGRSRRRGGGRASPRGSLPPAPATARPPAQVWLTTGSGEAPTRETDVHFDSGTPPATLSNRGGRGECVSEIVASGPRSPTRRRG